MTSELLRIADFPVEDILLATVVGSLHVVEEGIGFDGPIMKHSVSSTSYIYDAQLLKTATPIDWSRLLRLLIMLNHLTIGRLLTVTSILARMRWQYRCPAFQNCVVLPNVWWLPIVRGFLICKVAAHREIKNSAGKEVVETKGIWMQWALSI